MQVKLLGRRIRNFSLKTSSIYWYKLLQCSFIDWVPRPQTQLTQDEIARIRKRKRSRNMLNRSGNTTDNLCFRYRFRDVFSRFRCCVYNGTGPLLRKHNGNMELHVSATFQKYGKMWFRPVLYCWLNSQNCHTLSSNWKWYSEFPFLFLILDVQDDSRWAFMVLCKT